MKSEDRPVNWAIWRFMPNVKIYHAVALSLGIDPGQVKYVKDSWMAGPDLLFDESQNFNDRLMLVVSNVASLKVVAISTSDRSKHEINLGSFAAWTQTVGWEVPDELRELAKSQQELNDALGVRARDFEPDASDYARELHIAYLAWSVVASDSNSTGLPKVRLKEWLDKNYPDLSKEAKERIATVCNWDKKGGKKTKS